MSRDIPLRTRVIARSLVHASLGIAFAVALRTAPRVNVATAAAVLMGILLFGEFISFAQPPVRQWLRRRFDLLMRPEEDARVTGATYFLIGITTTITIFPPEISVLAVLFLAFGDPIAAAIGRWLGRTTPLSKNMVGHMACLVVCLLVAAFGAMRWPSPGIGAGAIGALAATVAQALPWRVNDNLTIPIGSAAFMFLAVQVFGSP